MLLLSHSPFLFGYAKPVPVTFRALRNLRLGMVWWRWPALPPIIALALLAAPAFHRSSPLVPARCCAMGGRQPQNALCYQCRAGGVQHASDPVRWTAAGSRSGCCRGGLPLPLSRLEPYGMLILIGLLIAAALGRCAVRSKS